MTAFFVVLILLYGLIHGNLKARLPSREGKEAMSKLPMALAPRSQPSYCTSRVLVGKGYTFLL